MTLANRDLRLTDGFGQFPTGMPVKTLTVGFSDRDAEGDVITIELPGSLRPVRIFCALRGGSIDSGFKVHTDITFEDAEVQINVPAVTGEQSNYEGWIVVEMINTGSSNNAATYHGEDLSGPGDP
jgi:hypothetical protein